MMVLFEFKATADMDETLRQQTCEWLTSLGADPHNVRGGHVVRAVGGYELHLTEMVRGEDGRIQLDGVKRIVQLGDVADWPRSCSACE